MDNNNNITNMLAVVSLALAILALVIAAVAPILGALSGLILAAFIAGGLTCVWADRRLRSPNS